MKKGEFPKNACVLGFEFLAYILQIDQLEIEKLIADGGAIDQQKIEILAQIELVMSELFKIAPYSHKIGFSEQTYLQQLKLKDGRFLFSALRDSVSSGPPIVAARNAAENVPTTVPAFAFLMAQECHRTRKSHWNPVG